MTTMAHSFTTHLTSLLKPIGFGSERTRMSLVGAKTMDSPTISIDRNLKSTCWSESFSLFTFGCWCVGLSAKSECKGCNIGAPWTPRELFIVCCKSGLRWVWVCHNNRALKKKLFLYVVTTRQTWCGAVSANPCQTKHVCSRIWPKVPVPSVWIVYWWKRERARSGVEPTILMK